MKSIWMENIYKPHFISLNKNLEVDVLIIGGGLTGISTAYHLKDSNLKVALIEQNEIGMGVSAKTTAKLTYLQDTYLKIREQRGLNATRMYLESQKEAIQLVKSIIEKHHIDCDFTENRCYLYVHQDMSLIQKFQLLCQQLNIPIEITENQKGIFISDSYVFHPLKYIYALTQIVKQSGVQIYEHTSAISLKKVEGIYICHTEHYQIKAKSIVIASLYPFFVIPYWMPLKVRLEKYYLSAYKIDSSNSWNALSLDEPLISHRLYGDYAIHLSNEKIQKKHPYDWVNHDVMTYDSLPFIGPIDKEQQLFMATGYNTWGMTNASLGGYLLAKYLTKQTVPYASLFNPKRSICVKHAPAISKNILENMTAYFKAKKEQPKNIRYETREGRKVAIYKDQNQKEHIVYPKCPHLYCDLIFNEIDLTWDCPCHGSRFDLDGKAIEGPSQFNISYPKQKNP